MKLEYLNQAVAILGKCGRPHLPGGVSAVPIPKSFVMPMVFPGIGNPVSQTFTKEIVGDAPWMLRAISFDQASVNQLGSPINLGLRLQIQLPSGRFLFGGNGVDLGQFAWIGSWRWLQDPGIRFEPGDKINVTLTGIGTTLFPPITSTIAVNLLFEGAYVYFMKGGRRVADGDASLADLPRYQGTLNENIMAPPWASDEGISTPPGYVDEYFVYSTVDPVKSADPSTASTADQLTTWAITAGAVVSGPSLFEIQIDPGYEFFCRRVLIDTAYNIPLFETVAGTVLGRLRTGVGYALNNSNIDLQRYICGAEFAGRWQITGGDSVYIDAVLADVSGTGMISLQVFLEGWRRRKA